MTARRVLVGLLLLVSSLGTGAAAEARQSQRLSDGWRFTRGNPAGAERPDFDDSSWQSITDAQSLEPFIADSVKLFHGKAMFILRTERGQAGTIHVRATSERLRGADATLISR